MAAALSAELDALLARALDAIPRQQAAAPRRVWIDVGTWRQTLSKADLEADAGLIVIGLEALPSNLNAPTQPTTARFVRVHGACADQPAGATLTFNQHTSPSCGSLLQTHKGAPRVGKGADACVGDTPRPSSVRAVPLSLLIDRARSVLSARRIELIKLDVQGSELDCIASGGAGLRAVENVLLEAQDATERSGLMLYEGASRLPEIDAALGGTARGAQAGARPHARGQARFTRQYCEWNVIAKRLREMNCLYRNAAQQHAAWLWATGNRQLVGGRWGSMVSYGDRPCFLRPMRLATDLTTSAASVGERMRHDARQAQLRGLSPLHNETTLAVLRGSASAAGSAPAAVARAQRRNCEANGGQSYS